MTEEIFTTHYKRDGRTFSGYVVAESWDEAREKAEEKGHELRGKLVHLKTLDDDEFEELKRAFGL